MNRTDRLYAIVEELRAVAPRPRSASWLADRFEVSRRTIERDIGALQQTGVPVWAEPGRTGGYCLDRARTLPPVNFSPAEAVSVAVALGGLAGTPFAPAGSTALRKILAAMRDDDATAAHDLAARVHLLG
uniref:helix-turn-helix transcriptional regulator n=1 Tax=Promicromonospora kroppenstedtii TaxID=440482 RepID=UPI0005670DCB